MRLYMENVKLRKEWKSNDCCFTRNRFFISTAEFNWIASGIGQGLQQLVQAIFLTGNGTTESPYALSVYGLSDYCVCPESWLAIGLSKLVVNWLTSLGN